MTLLSRRSGLDAAHGVRWESDGKGQYTLETVERLDRGTTIVLMLRDGEDDLLNGWRLRSIIEKHSDHVSVPILMPGEPEAPAEETADASKRQPFITVNRASALWTHPKGELSDKDYNDFYQHSPANSLIRSPGCTAGSKESTTTRCCCSSRPAHRTTYG